ncbi:MAG: hypothetical protein ACREX1_03440 [Advenella sp.]
MIKTPFPGKPLRWWDLIPVMGFIVCALAFYPGIMTPDTLDQLAQANSQSFNDWHPPMMAWLWSGLNRVFPAASGFLFFDLFLLWFGLYCVNRRVDHRYAPFVYVLGFLPFVINLSGVVWKDVATAYALLWAAIVLLRPPSRSRLALFSLFIFVAIGIRYNSFFSCLPLIVAYFWQQFANRQVSYKWARVLVLSCVFFIAQLTFLNLFNYHFLNTTKGTPQIVIMVDDLAYMSTQMGHSLVPGVDLATVTRSSQVSVSDNVFRYSHALDYEAVKASWKAAVSDHPWMYLQFRGKVFLRFLGFSLAPPFQLDKPSYGYWLDSSYQSSQTNGIRRMLGQYVKTLAQLAPFFFTGAFWLAVVAVTFCLSVASRLPYRTVTLALSLSAGINLMSYLLVANAPFFRYYYWSIVAGSLAVFLLLLGFSRQRQAKGVMVVSKL